MFDVILQHNGSDIVALDKTVNDIATFSGELRDECSIIDPVIVIHSALENFVNANYLTIPLFGRSYFIREIVAVTNGLTEISAHVDVLSSFATEIRNNSGIVQRQENDWNMYLADDVIRCYQNPLVTTMEFPSGFSGHSYVLLVAGRRDVGIDVGQGGTGSGTGIDGGGTGNSGSKTTSGMLQYAVAMVGKPYWYGTYGNTADAALLSLKETQYPDMYDTAIVGGAAFNTQFGDRVHDCVGLIKGYRWSDSPTADPVYKASEDVNVKGLYSQCTRRRGSIDLNNLSAIPVGAVLFYPGMEHCGVYAGGVGGHVIEARGHAYGVQYNTLTDRPGFTLWAVPDWMQVG